MPTQSTEDRFGIDELLQLTGTNREAKALAFLYAAFKRTEISTNPVQDALDCLIPFIVPYFNSISGKQILVDGVKQYLSITYGFDIPLYAIDQLIPTLSRDGYVEYRKYAKAYFAKKQEPKFETTKQAIGTQFDVVVAELGTFAEKNGFILSPPSGSWSEALINFLKSRSERSGRQISNIKGVVADIQSIEATIVGAFIKYLNENNRLLFDQLLNVFMGVLIEEFISSISELGSVVNNNPVYVLYDTAVLLRLLGCSGRLERTAMEELNRYLQDLGFRTYYFSGNEEEVANILDTIISVKDSGRELEGETAEALSSGEVTMTDIRMLQNTFTDRLATYNVFPAEDLEKRVIDNAAYQIDERGFGEYIKKEALVRGVGYRLQNRENDASYLGAIMRLRRRLHTRDLASCGYVFVTTNRFLARTSKRFLLEHKIIRGTQCPPMLSVGQIATIAWLMKEHVLAPEKAGRELLSNCFAAIRPDQDWFKSFREHVEKTTGPVEEYAKAPKNALILQATRRIAQDESFGNSAIVRELNMAEILKRAEEDSTRAWDAREAEFAAQREATMAENNKIIEALRAQEDSRLHPIAAAIASALETLESELARASVKDAYQGLKSILSQKIGQTSDVLKSISGLEENPKSKGRALVLSESAVEAHLENDGDIVRATDKLLKELERGKTSTTGVHIETTMTGGVAGVAGAQMVSINEMHVHSGQGNAQAQDRSKGSNSRPIQIEFGEGGDFETVARVGSNRCKTVRIKIHNLSDNQISNCRLDILNLDPPNKGVTECLVKNDITIMAYSAVFFDIACYDVGTSNQPSGAYVKLIVPANGTIFAEANEYAQLPLELHSFDLMLSRFFQVLDRVSCLLYFDDHHSLSLRADDGRRRPRTKVE